MPFLPEMVFVVFRIVEKSSFIVCIFRRIFQMGTKSSKSKLIFSVKFSKWGPNRRNQNRKKSELDSEIGSQFKKPQIPFREEMAFGIFIVGLKIG
jgi:hypothetical protein